MQPAGASDHQASAATDDRARTTALSLSLDKGGMGALTWGSCV